MLLGLQLMPTHPSEHGNHADTLLAVVRACEEAGLDSVWMADHFMCSDEENPEREVPILECFATLGAIAAVTGRIRIGQLVLGVPYRNPALLAKSCATLDVISHGRTIVGLGAAWHEPEFTAYGWVVPAGEAAHGDARGGGARRRRDAHPASRQLRREALHGHRVPTTTRDRCSSRDHRSSSVAAGNGSPFVSSRPTPTCATSREAPARSSPSGVA